MRETARRVQLDVFTGLAAEELVERHLKRLPLDIPQRQIDRAESMLASAIKRRVSSTTTAPDGYELKMRTGGGTGLVGDLFGMGRYDRSVSLVNRGRVLPTITTELPAVTPSRHAERARRPIRPG